MIHCPSLRYCPSFHLFFCFLNHYQVRWTTTYFETVSSCLCHLREVSCCFSVISWLYCGLFVILASCSFDIILYFCLIITKTSWDMEKKDAFLFWVPWFTNKGKMPLLQIPWKLWVQHLFSNKVRPFYKHISNWGTTGKKTLITLSKLCICSLLVSQDSRSGALWITNDS